LTLLAEIGLRHRSFTKFLLHVAIFVFANHFAYFIRFDFQIPRQYFPVIRETIPVLLVTKALGFLTFGQFRGWWRYVSIKNVLPVAGACMFGTVILKRMKGLGGYSSRI
jgi:FlaA1/EpsC-like NDP-sugar epimerase